jgi:serine protease inhibitor
MTRREWISGLPAGLALLGAAPAGAQRQAGKELMSDSSVETAGIAVAAQRTFGLRLLCDLVDRAPRKNVFISPLSVFLALHMTENGAAGATRTAMRQALALPDLDPSVLNASSAALLAILQSQETSALTIADALWADRHFTLDPDFVKLCGSLFGARAESLDFADPWAAAEINDWVKTATHGKIASIVTPQAVAKAAVILTNAVYFAGQWRKEFPLSQTQNGTFHLTGGGSKTAPLMHLARLTGAYRSGANFEGAVLYYKQSSVFLYALLPREGNTPRDVLASLDAGHLAAGPPDFDLDLKLPRFSLDFSASLAGPLEKMGMEVAFHDPQADFGPMGSRQFFISDVLHKTRLEVDEKGTVAAAATAVTMGAAAMLRPRPLKTLVFDRPFAVVIADSQTGAILFAGAIEDP